MTATASEPQRVARAAEGEGGRPERGHRPGPQHGRLGARQHDEPGDQPERQRPAGERSGPGQQRPGGGQQERHVLPADGGEVRQAAVAEALDHLRRLVAVVADDQTPGQRRLVGRQRRTRHARSAPAPGWTATASDRRGARSPTHDSSNDADDVLPGDTTGPVVVERLPSTVHEDPVAAHASRPRAAGGPSPDPQLVALALDLQQHPRARRRSAGARRRRPPRPWHGPTWSGARPAHDASDRTTATR